MSRDYFDDLHFDGSDYDPDLDQIRLTGQAKKIYYLMRDRKWRSLREISDATGAPEASASACLRDFRKERFNYHTVNKRRRGEPKSGLWEYQVLPPEPQPGEQLKLI